MSIFRNIFDQIEKSKQEAARVSHVLVRTPAARWKQKASKAFNNFWKYIVGDQEEEGYEDVSDLEEEEEFEDTAGEKEVDRRRGKKERKKIVFEK